MNKIISMNIDYHDLHVNSEDFGYRNYDEDKIRILMEKCVHSGFNRIFWRISVCGKVNFPSKVEDVYDYGRDGKLKISEQFDPLRIAVKYAKESGVEIYAWMTLFDDNPIVMMNGNNDKASRLCNEYPEWQECSRDGKTYYPGFICMAYPEVRTHKLAIIKELSQYDLDGVYLCTRSHSRTPELLNASGKYVAGEIDFSQFRDTAQSVRNSYGFNPPIVNEYKNRYGVDIRNEEFDTVLLNRLHGEYLTLFLQEAKNVLKQYGKKLCVMIKDEFREETPAGHKLGILLSDMYIDWENWSANDTVDELCLYDGNGEGGGLNWWNFNSEHWEKESLNFLRNYKDSIKKGQRLLIWLDAWAWIFPRDENYLKKYGMPSLPWHYHTRPAKVVDNMIKAVLESEADGFTMHEAMNIEWFSTWNNIRRIINQ